MELTTHIAAKGWALAPPEAATLAWCQAARRRADVILEDPQLCAQWLRHGRTWFVGVDVLEADAQGAVAGGPPLAGVAHDIARAAIGAAPWDKGQLSVMYAGYPQQDADESDANHRFRLNRDAAHLDGLLPIGADRRRKLLEPHGIIMGLALDDVCAGNSPLVVWEGSHHIIRRAFHAALTPHDPATWPELDLTEIYSAARREVFETCPRIEVSQPFGATTVLHRMTIHGVAPWRGSTDSTRSVAYFRPQLSQIADWLSNP